MLSSIRIHVRRMLVAGAVAAAVCGATVVPADAATAHPYAPITCTLTIDFPHKSSHDPGYVKVTAKIGCTAPVTSASVTVQLYQSGTLVNVNTVTTTGSALVVGNTKTPCRNGSYQGVGTGTVKFPPTYLPPVATLGPVPSGITTIKC